jgi:hypothetical protein
VADVDGKCFHLIWEETCFRTQKYSCLVVWNCGHHPRVSIENLNLAEPLPKGLQCLTAGQRLVQGGVAIDTEALVQMATVGQFYDLRHLFLFGRIPRGANKWIDAGLGAFWNDGKPDTDAVARALRGGRVEVDVMQFKEEDVHRAMRGRLRQGRRSEDAWAVFPAKRHHEGRASRGSVSAQHVAHSSITS